MAAPSKTDIDPCWVNVSDGESEGRAESADCDAIIIADNPDDTRILQAAARHVDDDDANGRDVVVVLTDVTSRVRTEEELERSNEDLEQFA